MWNFAESSEAAHWESLVAAHGGYPLQTAMWASARESADGTPSERLLLQRDGRTVLLARVEVRHHRIAGRVAWLPQGPIYVDAESACEASRVLKAELKARGYQLCFENPYPSAPSRYHDHGTAIGGPAQTSVVDLSVGEEALWNRLSSNWRNNVRAAERAGMVVNEARDAGSIRQFVAECERLSTTKGFRYQGGEAFVAGLLRDADRGDVAAKLFCASLEGRFQGGMLVMIVGKTMQLIFSAATRGEPSPGRLLQWTAMKAAINANVTRYDLGGMDPEGNPGVYEFKRQLRGELVTIPPIRASALSLRGKIALMGCRALRRV
jgi:Acetyltransferase (GNAT) domain